MLAEDGDQRDVSDTLITHPPKAHTQSRPLLVILESDFDGFAFADYSVRHKCPWKNWSWIIGSLGNVEYHGKSHIVTSNLPPLVYFWVDFEQIACVSSAGVMFGLILSRLLVFPAMRRGSDGAPEVGFPLYFQ